MLCIVQAREREIERESGEEWERERGIWMSVMNWYQFAIVNETLCAVPIALQPRPKQLTPSYVCVCESVCGCASVWVWIDQQPHSTDSRFLCPLSVSLYCTPIYRVHFTFLIFFDIRVTFWPSFAHLCVCQCSTKGCKSPWGRTVSVCASQRECVWASLSVHPVCAARMLSLISIL